MPQNHRQYSRLFASLIIHQLAGLSSRQHILLLAQLDYQPENIFKRDLAFLQTYKVSERANAVLAAAKRHLSSDDACATFPEIVHIEKQIHWMQSEGIRLIHYGGEHYSSLLASIPQPPPYLYLQGDEALLDKSCLAVIGSRKATATGLKAAATIIADLASMEIVICSGMAKGIDAAAHQAALQHNLPTIAVLGTGIDIVYPKTHAILSKRISQRGLLVSEFALGTQPRPYHFPQRNRIISGLSMGVLVVEAGEKSGSLITADFALEQGRDVFAVPGSLNNTQAVGCNSLLKQGAILTSSAQDIIENLNLNLSTLYVERMTDDYKVQSLVAENHLSVNEQTVLASIEDQGNSLQELQAYNALESAILYQVLSSLEQKGLIQQRWGFYQRVPL